MIIPILILLASTFLWIAISLSRIADHIQSVSLKGKMTAEKADRIRPFLLHMIECNLKQDVEGYNRALDHIRSIEAE